MKNALRHDAHNSPHIDQRSCPGRALPDQAITAIFAGLIAAASAGAQAQELLVRHGEDSRHYQNDGLTLRLAPAWSKDMGSWATDLRPELEINHFRYTGPGPTSGPQTLNQAGAIAFLNIHANGEVRPYAEIGAGLAAFSHDRLGHKDFSTRYQFSEHLGLGVEFAERWSIGWRYSHYSNGGAKKPNDGLDFNQLLIGFRF
ncbi:MAG: acyloxyacyl hydrolase [Betaproteobacteria bacterium]